MSEVAGTYRAPEMTVSILLQVLSMIHIHRPRTPRGSLGLGEQGVLQECAGSWTGPLPFSGNLLVQPEAGCGHSPPNYVSQEKPSGEDAE